MDQQIDNLLKSPSDSDHAMVEELERRGFRVHITRHNGGRLHDRYYCRIRNHANDVTFFGESKIMSLEKALTSLRPSADTD
jgi:hypothetical protein